MDKQELTEALKELFKDGIIRIETNLEYGYDDYSHAETTVWIDGEIVQPYYNWGGVYGRSE